MNAGSVCLGHTWTALRMAPGMVCLAASVLALFCAIVLKNYGLCIPFGLSMAASGLTIFFAYQARHLKSFEKNNKELKVTADKYKKLVAAHRDSNQILQTYIGQLGKIKDALSLIKDSDIKHDDQFVMSLRTLSVLSTRLEQAFSNHNKENFDLAQALKDQREDVIKVGQVFKGIFEALKIWTSKKEIQSRITEFRQVKDDIQAAAKDLEIKLEVIDELKTLVDAFREQILGMGKANKGLDESDRNISANVQRLKNIASKLERLLKQKSRQDLLQTM